MNVLSLGLARTQIEVRQLLRDREASFWTLAFPVVLIVIFGSVFGNQKIGPTDVTFAQYLFAGMIASGVLYSAFQNLAISIPQEREDGTLKRLQGLPMHKASYFIGKVGLVFVTYISQTVILIALGVAFYGIELPNSLELWLRFIWISVLGLVACTLLGLAFSVVPKTGKGASAVVSPIVLVLQFTSGVFFMYNSLPSWMQQFSALFPLKWLTQGMRGVFLPESVAVIEPAGTFEVMRTAMVLGGWTIAAAILALVFFRWNTRGEQ